MTEKPTNQTQSQENGTDSSLPRAIQHIGITVPDMDEATTFFQEALGAKIAYDGLTEEDEPRQGAEVERQLGLPKGAAIHKQRFLVIGNGPGLEVFEISGEQREPLGLADFGINHMAFYCDDIEATKARMEKAGAKALSEVHGNSRYEDSEGNGSVYLKTPWGMLIELQTIPHGHYYPDYSEAKAWMPEPR